MAHFVQSVDKRAVDFDGLETKDIPPSGVYVRFLKRVLDIFLVLMALPVVVTVIAICAILIKRDGGPAFYTQPRVGRHGKTFSCWKLRSMIVDADARLEAYLQSDAEARIEWDVHQKLRHDPRITRIGHFIRKTSIDELPQLWCVLKGDMSIVGPRPFLPEQKALYTGNAYYNLRPGLTGKWQVSDRNEVSFAERASIDTQYARELSAKSDFDILLKTVGVVLRGTGH